VSYIYIKKSAPPPRQSKSKKKKAASLFLALGLLFLSFAVVPIIKFQLLYSVNFTQLMNPLSTKSYNSSSILGDSTTDYTQISNWFSSDPSKSDQIFSNGGNLITYNLSIPKLKISNAAVTFGSMDLKKSLIQYPQTALPGQLGNTVIFGHSALPQFFSSKNYLTIFSTLYKLEKGDEILIDYDNVQYEYIVDEIFETTPDDFSVLDQRYDQKNISLITCSPPGTYLRRLIIKASLSVK
jgi:sortase A